MKIEYLFLVIQNSSFLDAFDFSWFLKQSTILKLTSQLAWTYRQLQQQIVKWRKVLVWITYVMRCAICYNLYNLKNVKTSMEELLLVKLHANSLQLY